MEKIKKLVYVKGQLLAELAHHENMSKTLRKKLRKLSSHEDRGRRDALTLSLAIHRNKISMYQSQIKNIKLRIRAIQRSLQ